MSNKQIRCLLILVCALTVSSRQSFATDNDDPNLLYWETAAVGTVPVGIGAGIVFSKATDVYLMRKVLEDWADFKRTNGVTMLQYEAVHRPNRTTVFAGDIPGTGSTMSEDIAKVKALHLDDLGKTPTGEFYNSRVATLFEAETSNFPRGFDLSGTLKDFEIQVKALAAESKLTNWKVAATLAATAVLAGVANWAWNKTHPVNCGRADGSQLLNQLGEESTLELCREYSQAINDGSFDADKRVAILDEYGIAGEPQLLPLAVAAAK